MQQKQSHHPLFCQTWHLHSPWCNLPADDVVKRFCYVILTAADVASSCYWPQAEMRSRLQRSAELTSFQTLLKHFSYFQTRCLQLQLMVPQVTLLEDLYQLLVQLTQELTSEFTQRPENRP